MDAQIVFAFWFHRLCRVYSRDRAGTQYYANRIKSRYRDDGVKHIQPPRYLSHLYMYVERYVRWGCILNCFMPSPLLVFLLLLFCYLHIILHCIIESVDSMIQCMNPPIEANTKKIFPNLSKSQKRAANKPL